MNNEIEFLGAGKISDAFYPAGTKFVVFVDEYIRLKEKLCGFGVLVKYYGYQIVEAQYLSMDDTSPSPGKIAINNLKRWAKKATYELGDNFATMQVKLDDLKGQDPGDYWLRQMQRHEYAGEVQGGGRYSRPMVTVKNDISRFWRDEQHRVLN